MLNHFPLTARRLLGGSRLRLLAHRAVALPSPVAKAESLQQLSRSLESQVHVLGGLELADHAREALVDFAVALPLVKLGARGESEELARKAVEGWASAPEAAEGPEAEAVAQAVEALCAAGLPDLAQRLTTAKRPSGSAAKGGAWPGELERRMAAAHLKAAIAAGESPSLVAGACSHARAALQGAIARQAVPLDDADTMGKLEALFHRGSDDEGAMLLRGLGARARSSLAPPAISVRVRNVEFLRSAASVETMPQDFAVKEALFVGRSNVGKSSLLNMVAGRPMAHTSKTPGKTRLFNFFRVDTGLVTKSQSLHLIDMPGMGYARAGREKREEWRTLLHEYIAARGTPEGPLRLVLHLVDSRHGPNEADVDLMESMREWACRSIANGASSPTAKYAIVLTKWDKSDALASSKPLDELHAALAQTGWVGERGREVRAASAGVVLTSARAGEGRDRLWQLLEAQCLASAASK